MKSIRRRSLRKSRKSERKSRKLRKSNKRVRRIYGGIDKKKDLIPKSDFIIFENYNHSKIVITINKENFNSNTNTLEQKISELKSIVQDYLNDGYEITFSLDGSEVELNDQAVLTEKFLLLTENNISSIKITIRPH